MLKTDPEIFAAPSICLDLLPAACQGEDNISTVKAYVIINLGDQFSRWDLNKVNMIYVTNTS